MKLKLIIKYKQKDKLFFNKINLIEIIILLQNKKRKLNEYKGRTFHCIWDADTSHW